MAEFNLLFGSASEAEKFAWTVRGEWDGYNGVLVANSDRLTIKTAAAMLEAEFCYAGDSCHIKKNLEPQDLRRFEFSPMDFNPYQY